jgi:dsDNA-specific endonuclease/ATPase MutS2
MGDVGNDVRWMSYAELGQVRGISTASATRLAFRRKWRRQSGNDGTVRVAVPIDEAKPQKAREDKDDDRADITRAVTALETAVSTLRDQFEHERGRAERAEQAREAERTRADRAEEEQTRLETVLETEQTARASAEAVAAEARDEVSKLRQAEQDRRARGLLGRLRGAWRGE